MFSSKMVFISKEWIFPSSSSSVSIPPFGKFIPLVCSGSLFGRRRRREWISPVCGKISPECVGGEDFSDILDDHHLRFSFWSFSLTTLPIFCLLYLLYTASPPASLIASLYHLDSLFFSLFSRFFLTSFGTFPLVFSPPVSSLFSYFRLVFPSLLHPDTDSEQYQWVLHILTKISLFYLVFLPRSGGWWWFFLIFTYTFSPGFTFLSLTFSPPPSSSSSSSSFAAEEMAKAAPLSQLDMDFNEYCRRGDGKRVIQLLGQGVNVNCRDEHYGWTPLHNAAREGYNDIMKVLIHKGADVNARDFMGQTPLHRAAQRGHKKAVNFLMFAGADPVIQDNLEQNPSDVAKSERHEEVFLLLLKATHKRERELLEERRKNEKLQEKLRKKEKKEQEKQEKQEMKQEMKQKQSPRFSGSLMGGLKGKRMLKARSISMEGGLQHFQTRAEAGGVAGTIALASSSAETDLGGKKRLSAAFDAFTSRDKVVMSDDGSSTHSRTPPKLIRSNSTSDKGDLWMSYINGTTEDL